MTGSSSVQAAIKKVVVIGPESTGKSTLSRALAEKLETTWVKEYAREYVEQLDRPYQKEDLLAIAKGQIATEESQLLHARNGLLICDTDLYVIKVWSEHRYNDCHEYILHEIATRKYDHYLLCSIDLPWEYDPQREYPGITERKYFFDIYKDIVQQSGVSWTLISGNPEERLLKSIDAIKKTTQDK